MNNFTKNDVGCYGDGTFGHQHVRERLSDTLKEISHGVIVDKTPCRGLHHSLEGPMPDDASDENEALELLNNHTNEGLEWIMENGDLLLIEIDAEISS